MPRSHREFRAGEAYHVTNRSVPGLKLFETAEDYAAFETVLAQARHRFPAVRICAYCVMPNHFHLVLWPCEDEAISLFMK